MSKYTISSNEGLNVTIEVVDNVLDLCEVSSITELGVVGCILGIAESVGNDESLTTTPSDFNEFSVIDVSSLVTLVGVVKYSEKSMDLVVKTAIDCNSTYIRNGAEVVPISSVINLLQAKGLKENAVHSDDK